jgi:general secretion pathway protein L
MVIKILGVDIGTYSIKIAELDSSGKGFSFTNYYEFPLSLDPSRDRGLQIIETLRAFAVKYNPITTKWVVGISQHKVSIHHKRFPFRERSKIQKSLAFELEDEIPLDIDETIFDAKVIESFGQMADVLTVACPKDAIEDMLSLTKDGGFDPDIISVESLALANIFENWNATPRESLKPPPEPEETNSDAPKMPSAPKPLSPSRLILHLGHSRSLLLVYRESGLVAVRSIQWGGLEIAEAIAQSFNVPIFEAVKVLQTKSFILMSSAGATKDQLHLSKTISTVVDILLKELRLTMIEVKSAFHLDLKQIDLLGGVSQIQNLGPYFTQGLEVPTNVVQHPVADSHPLFPLTPHIEAVAPVALGLAIEGLKRPRNPAINLRRGEFARENLSFNRFWAIWRVPAQAVLAAFLIFCIYSIARDQIASGLVTDGDDKLTEVATKAAMLKGTNANEAGVRKYIKTQDIVVKSREALAQIDDYIPAMEILAKISEKLPVMTKPTPGQGIDITNFVVDNDEAHIEGRAQGAAQIPQIEKALNEIARPKTVKKDVAKNALPGGGTQFAYKFSVKRKP